MIAKVKTSVINDLKAIPVDVESQISRSNQRDSLRFEIIGLADTAVREARQRVETVLNSAGIKIVGKILVNLSPAEIKKDGASFDLPIAVSLLVASRKLDFRSLKNCAFYGELALDGSVKKVKGLLAHAICSKLNQIKRIYVPWDNYQEASLVKDIEIVPLKSLKDLILILQGKPIDIVPEMVVSKNNSFKNDLAEVYGQAEAKRALLIAAAGGHNCLFVGPPGCGKSMLAACLPSLLPDLTENEQIESAKIYSISGLDCSQILSGTRPFRDPHHIISEVGLVGGGARPKAGEVSLAHNGVLFMDEFPEYRRSVLEALRAPLENHYVNIARAKYNLRLPASFQLIAAMNPCPCGKLGVVGKDCLCSPKIIQNYLRKLSQPILDRIDLQISLQPVDLNILKKDKVNNEFDNSLELIKTVQSLARSRSNKLNAFLNNQEIKHLVRLNSCAKSFIDNFMASKNLSARGYFRMLRLALTISNLEQSESIREEHLAEAYSFRSLDLIKEYSS